MLNIYCEKKERKMTHPLHSYTLIKFVTKSMERGPSWEADGNSAGPGNSPPFVEQGVSMPCSHGSAGGPYPGRIHPVHNSPPFL
jgi:hypothetical protein